MHYVVEKKFWENNPEELLRSLNKEKKMFLIEHKKTRLVKSAIDLFDTISQAKTLLKTAKSCP